MKKKIKKLFFIIILSFFISFFIVNKIGKKLNPVIESYSTIEAERFGTYMINYSLDRDFINSLDDDIFEITKNSKGEIQIIDFKTKKVNKMLEMATKEVQSNLIKLENGDISDFDFADTFKNLKFKKIRKGVVCELPEGMIYSNFLLANYGPVIPVKFNFIGQVTSNIQTRLENYGINNVYFEVLIHIEVKERISMPVRSEEITVKTTIPISMKVIQGSIPNYYQTPLVSDSNQFSFPIY